jgi:two-component system response regulator YesN
MKIVSSTEKNPILQTSKIIAEEIPHIVFAIETYDKVKLQAILDKLNDYFHNTNEKLDVVKKNIIYCIIEVRNKLILKYPERDFLENVSDDFLPDILSKKTFGDVSNYLKQILFTFLENFNFNTTESVIVKLIAYLKNNYSEDLKLETLGDMFNCNSAYLGKKFKKYTGVQFNTYLDNIRIDVAKEKLRTTDLKIYQISKLIGFTNTDYFFMKFKKYTGLTPKEYKIQCQEGNKIDEE